ncbi:MAG: hypothetical protein DMD99_13935 [Candidatus Rokuibacteriota bacterium]|nr:MAG: hypothetical protein DMD99_13935 [Candidatus Rokubacteria bacterium]
MDALRLRPAASPANGAARPHVAPHGGVRSHGPAGRDGERAGARARERARRLSRDRVPPDAQGRERWPGARARRALRPRTWGQPRVPRPLGRRAAVRRRLDPGGRPRRERRGGSGVSLRRGAAPRHALARLGLLLRQRRRAGDFYGDPAVLTISTHERGDYLFPGTGFVEEAGVGAGAGYSVNLPLEPFTESSVYLPAFEQVVPPLFGAFRPDVVVAQLGIDSHRTDPLTHLALDIQGFARAVTRITELSPKLVCLGGGGYDLPNVARAWTAAWAVLNGVELPATLPASFGPDARRYEFPSDSLWDPVEPLPDHRHLRAQEYAARQVDAIRRTIFPIHHL